MPTRPGTGANRVPRDAACGAVGMASGLGLALWMWGFTVDDALISVRYARHLADGAGWRFNAGGPSTDGVTPLPWPLVLAPLAHAHALVVLARAKALGLAAWLAAAGGLGRSPSGARRPAWAKRRGCWSSWRSACRSRRTR